MTKFQMEDENESQPLLGSVRTVRVAVEYDSIQQVTVSLPQSSSRGGGPVESPLESIADPKSINIDEPAPTSYVCLGYTFSIIAGFCFTFR